MDKLKYPIGPFEKPESLTKEVRKGKIDIIKSLPIRLRQAIHDLTNEQLDTPYREAGWTLRQVVHHIADSHLNGYMRFKLCLTESKPTIRPFDQDRWAALFDAKTADPTVSLNLLEGIHIRWGLLLASLTEEEFSRQFFHPDSKEYIDLNTAVCLYAWHGEHHIAHIAMKRKCENW